MPVYLRAVDFGDTATPEGGVIIRRDGDISLIAYDHRLSLADALGQAADLPLLTDEESEYLHHAGAVYRERCNTG